MSQAVNFKWPQGEDLNIQLVYKEGPSAGASRAVVLKDNYALRMDIVSSSGEVLYSYLSTEQPGALGTGQNGQPNISIFLPRSLTLPGGNFHRLMGNPPGATVFNYDMFLRNLATNRQFKILRGSITIERSSTLWL